MGIEQKQHVVETEKAGRLRHLEFYAALVKTAAIYQRRSPEEILREDLQVLDPKLFALLEQSFTAKDGTSEEKQTAYTYQTPFGELVFDRERLTAISPLLVDSQVVRLTPTEGRVFEELITRPDQVSSHTSLIKALLSVDGEFGQDEIHALRVTIARLRQKLGDVRIGSDQHTSTFRLIHTFRERGYSLSPQVPISKSI